MLRNPEGKQIGYGMGCSRPTWDSLWFLLHALFEVCRRQAPPFGGFPGSGTRLQRRPTTEGQADGAVRHEQDADVLRRRQAEVAGVRIGNVRSAQEVERESADAIEQRQQREEVVLQQLPARHREEDCGNRPEQHCIVQTEVMAWSAWKCDGQREVRQPSWMVVNRKAAQPRDRPARSEP